MKKVIVLSGIFLLIANILIGLILTCYETFNVCLNCGVILVTCALLVSLRLIQIKDALAISLSFLFSLLGIISFALGCITPQKFENNWYLFAIILVFTFEGLFLLITNLISNKN